MIRSLFRPAAGLVAAAALTIALLAVPAWSPSQAATFTFSNANCSSFGLVDNGGGNFTLNCQTSAPGTFGCSVGQSPSSPTLTSAVTLTASCQNAAGSITYTWTAAGGNVAGCPSITQPNVNPQALALPTGTSALSCGYSVSANDGTSSANANKTVSYASGGGGGGGGGGNPPPISCPGFSNTVVVDITPNGLWPTASQTLIDTINNGGFGPDTAYILTFLTPANPPAGTGKGYINGVEYQGVTSGRSGSLSATPCDFSNGVISFVNNPAPWVYFVLPGSTKSGAKLASGTRYYFNIMNTPGGNCTSSGACDMRFNFTKPAGT
jgi:hypothetical protein